MPQTIPVQPHRAGQPVTEHPTWCDPGSCTARNNGTGRHQSPPVELPAIEPNPLSVVVRLSQGAPMSRRPDPEIPLVSALLSDDDDGEIFDVMIYPEMARVLGQVLTQTANLSGQ